MRIKSSPMHRAQTRERVKNQERNDVGSERHQHGFAPPERIGKNPRWNFKDVRRYIADGIQKTDLQKRQPGFTKDQDDKRVEETQVLQESIQRETREHAVFVEHYWLSSCDESSNGATASIHVDTCSSSTNGTPIFPARPKTLHSPSALVLASVAGL